MAVRDEIAHLEDIVLSILLRNPDLVLTAPLDLTLFTRWKAVIHAIVKLSGRGITPDLFTISDEVGGDSLVSELGHIQMDVSGAPENYGYYLKTLRAKVTDLTMFEKLRSGMRAIADGSPSSVVLGELVTESLRIYSEQSDRQYSFTAKEMMRVMVEKLETIHNGDAMNQGIKTGISKLDDVLGALHPSDLIIVGARPGVGKTAFGVTVMLNAAKAGHKIGFISTEMSVDQIAYRVSAQIAKIDAKKYRSASFEDNEWSRLGASVSLLSELDYRICDKPVMKGSDVALQCRAWELDGGLDLVIVDYLTRIKPDHNTGNQNLDVGEIVTALKNLARDLKIPVMVLAQLNRQSTNRADSKPRMSDLRDSGIIEQEADSILLLHREEGDTGDKYNSIIVDKNRHGERVEATVEFDEPTMRWWCQDRPDF